MCTMTVSLFHVRIDEHRQIQHRHGVGGGGGVGWHRGSHCSDFDYLPENEGRRFLQNVCTLLTARRDMPEDRNIRL